MIIDRRSEMEEICYGCACEIKMGACERRKLYSNSTRHTQVYSFEDVEKLLPSLEPEGKEHEIYICMKYFRSLRRLYNLENERKELDTSLKAGIVKFGEWVKLQPRGKTSTPTTSKKCSRETTPPAAPPSKRRRGTDTPTRKVIQ